MSGSPLEGPIEMAVGSPSIEKALPVGHGERSLQFLVESSDGLFPIMQQRGHCRISTSCRVHSDSFENGRLAQSILAGEECHSPEAGDQEVLYPSKSLDVQVGEMEVGIDW